MTSPLYRGTGRSGWKTWAYRAIIIPVTVSRKNKRKFHVDGTTFVEWLEFFQHFYSSPLIKILEQFLEIHFIELNESSEERRGRIWQMITESLKFLVRQPPCLLDLVSTGNDRKTTLGSRYYVENIERCMKSWNKASQVIIFSYCNSSWILLLMSITTE